MAFYQSKIKSPEKLSKKLENEGIHIVLRKSKEGQLYGITYIDHKTQCVFNGSRLGKEFSAKGILEKCEQNISQDMYYRKTNLLSLEKIQNSETENSITNLLLRIENTNDYLPKQLKKKKKRNIRRGL